MSGNLIETRPSLTKIEEHVTTLWIALRDEASVAAVFDLINYEADGTAKPTFVSWEFIVQTINTWRQRIRLVAKL